MRYLKKDENVIFRLSVTPWSGIYRRKFLINKNIVFNDLLCANDLSFYSKVVTNAKRIMVTNDHVIVHRTNVADSLVSRRASHFDCDLQSVRIIEKQLIQDKVSEEVFNKMMLRMFNNVIHWCEKFCSLPDIGDDIYRQTEEFLNEFDYQFMPYLKIRFSNIKKT